MTQGLTITKQVHFRCAKRGRRIIREGQSKKTVDLSSVPRISRLMALAIHIEELIHQGVITDYAEAARLAHVSRARITQITNLLNLATDIQQELLRLPRSNSSRYPITERMVRPITTIHDWNKQKKMWNEVKTK